MTKEETEIQLKDTLEILERFFFRKCINSDLEVEIPSDNGWFYLPEKTAKELKRQIIKYQMRK